MVERLSQPLEVEGFPENLYFSFGRIKPHDPVGDTQFTLTGQPADPENLAFADVEVNPFDRFSRHCDLEVAQPHREVILLDRAVVLEGIVNQLFYLASDHEFRNLDHTAARNLFARNELSIPQDGHAVGNLHDLVQTVGNEDNRDPLRSDCAHRIQQPRGFAFSEHSGRLVEHKQLDTGLVDLAGNLDKLHVTDRHSLNKAVFIHLEADRLERLAGVPRHHVEIEQLHRTACQPAEEGGMADLAPHLDILCDGKPRDQHKFLMHHTDAQFHRLERRVDRNLLTVHLNAPLEPSGPMNDRHTEQDVH